MIQMKAKWSYDANGNPGKIYFTNGNVTKYVYSATGQKVSVEYYVAAPNVTVPFGTEPDALTQGQTMYAGSRQYLLGGSLVTEDGMIDKFLFNGGYAKASAVNPTTYTFSFYYYNQDHLGNNREVVDSAGTVRQITHYYPFGTPYADPSTILNASLQPYKYNGKELDRMHGLDTYDYGARQYNPVTARWDRMDPLCEKYYSISPYAYCHDNPIKFIDPDGRDEWEINSQGQITNRIKTKKHDAFFIVDDNNKRIEGKSISFKHGFVKRTFKSHTRAKEEVFENGKTIEKEENKYFDVYEMRGDANSTKLFEFLANNTSVEWSHMRFGVEGEKGLNVLTTSHIEDTEYGASSMLNKQYLYGYHMREHIHSHPRNTSVPSGFGKDEGRYDMEFARVLQGIRPNVRLKIYIPRTNSYINYNKESTKDDF